MKNNFGEFLRQNRLNKNLTQKELANLLFVSESAVSKWEKGVAHPDITLLPKLSEILGVSEHELITASIDNQARLEKTQARKWQKLSFAWSLFFCISYGIALLTCFICNLAIDKTLSWFWIVASALLLAYTITNLPKWIRCYKLFFIPLSIYSALCLLLGVCCLYAKGDWFFIAAVSVLLGLVIIFVPIYISRYKMFERIKKYNDFISVGLDFITLNLLLVVINLTSIMNGGGSWWYIDVALPIVFGIYLALNILLSVRFLKVNRFLKTSIILSLTDIFLYIIPLFIKPPLPEKELNEANIFKADLLNWQVNGSLENNIHCIIFLTILLHAIVFLIVGLIRYVKSKNRVE